jgi:hypothetical protein
MSRCLRMLLGVFALPTAACVGPPASAPVPADAGPAEVRAAALQDRCGRVRDQMSCYSEALLSVLEQEGVSQAMETLERLGDRDASVRRDGHMYAHAIGLAASPSPEEVGETFRNCRPSFQSGCYHGVIQSYFAALVGSGGQVDAGAVNSLCADYRERDADRWLLFQCVHGMGHGLTMLHDYHLPTALEGCDLLAEDWDREGCYGGVFMENIVNATTPHHAVGRPMAAEGEGVTHASHHGPAPAGGAHAAHPTATTPSAHANDPDEAGHDAHATHAATAAASTAAAGEDEHAAHASAGDDVHAGHNAAPTTTAGAARAPFPALDRSDPLYPCSALQDRYLNACYMMQTSAILFHNEGDLEATAAACDQAPERHRAACYISLGRDISAITMQDHAKARAACSLGDSRFNVWCHIGYVKNLVDLTAEPEDALTYCRAVESQELKQACYHAVGEEIWVLTSDRAQGEEWCSLAEDGHQEHCRRGAGLASWREVGAE